MDGIFIVVGMTIFLCGLVWAIRTPSTWNRLVFQAAKEEDVEPLVTELFNRPPLVQPRFYNEAMEYLYSQKPELSARLTMVFVPQFPEHKFSQKWMEQLRGLDREVPLLTTEFLEQYTRTSCATGAG